MGTGPAELGTDPSEDMSSACAPYFSCSSTPGATEVSVVNNCPGGARNVHLSIVAEGCKATVNAPCLENVGTTAASVWLRGSDSANNFRVGAFGSSTLFEVTHNASGQDWFDLSQNEGFDIGMTVVAPSSSDVPYIVCTSKNCPGAYPLGHSACETDPCLSPNYLAGATGQTFELYLCNGWPEDPRPPADHGVNTPGPLGCSYNQGTCIPPQSPSCPSGTAGSLACQWGHPVPGQVNPGGTCPLACPSPTATP